MSSTSKRKGLICAQGLLHRPADHVECAETDVVFGFGSATFHGQVSKDKHVWKKSDPHFSPGAY